MPNVGYIIVAVLGFGFIIFIHELGHFLAAKLFKVKVKAFSIGYPPTLLHKQIGETDYRLSAILAGGYLLMLGDEDEEAAKDDPRSLHNIAPWKRTVIFLAGVFMNIVSAMVIFIVASVVGIEVMPPVVGGLADPSPAKAAGLLPGERILSIDGEPIDTWEDLNFAVVCGGIDDPAHRFRVRVQGRAEALDIASTSLDGHGLPALGLRPPVVPVLTAVKAGSPADQAGLKVGDRILAVGQAKVEFAAQCADLLDELADKPFTITVERDGEETRLEVDPARLEEPNYGLFSLTKVARVEKGSAAQKAGLAVGDFIVDVPGHKFPKPRDFVEAVQASRGAPLAMRIWRHGQFQDISVAPEFKPLLGYYQVGIVPTPFDGPPALVSLGKPSAASAAGIPDGSLITAINGKRVKKWTTLLEELDKLDGQPAEVSFRPPGGDETKSVTVAPQRRPPETLLAGVECSRPVLARLRPIYSPLEAFAFGWRKVKRIVMLQYVTFKGLATQRVEASELSGPLRIGIGFYKMAETGSGTFMSFLGVISVAIALLNAMPIPPLDGGHVMFLAVEKVIRRPLSLRVRQVAASVGAALLLALIVLAFYNDINWIIQQFFS